MPVLGFPPLPSARHPPGISPGPSVPVAGASHTLTAFPIALHGRVLRQNPRRVPDSVPAEGQDSPGAQHLAYIAAHVSAHPPCRPQPAAELRMLGRCHSPCPSPAAFVFQPIGVKTCRDIRVILFPCEKRWPGRRRSPKLLPQHGKAAGTVQPRCEPPEEPRKTGFITRLFLKLLLQLCALFNC